MRRPYAETAPSVYDYPLSSRFDETDALVVFDRVFVPWERVFVYRDVALTQAQFYETPAHVLGNHQAQVRFASKAQFLAGVALRIAESIGVDKAPQTRTMLGELASYCAMASGLVLASEAECVHDARGFVYPNPTYLYANNWLEATYYQTMLTYLRELAGGGLLQVPSSYKDYLNPEIAADLERYVRSPGLKSVERTKLYKLAWDLVGSEFAGRHQQYELFYAGARAQTTAVRAYRAFDFAAARAMVERCLAGYDLPTAPPRALKGDHAQGPAHRRVEEAAGRAVRALLPPRADPEREPARRHRRARVLHRDYLASLRIPVEWHEPMAAAPTSSPPSARARPISCCRGTSTSFPAGQGWTRPPFSGAIEDGRVWGRGAGDMKAGLAVALTIASLVRELEAPLAGRLTLAFASDEETGGTWGTQWLLDNVAAVRGDACLIGESSGTWSAGIGEKGVLWLRLRASGVSGHAAYQQGTSAVAAVRAARRGRRGAARPSREGGQGGERGDRAASAAPPSADGDAAPAASPTRWR